MEALLSVQQFLGLFTQAIVRIIGYAPLWELSFAGNFIEINTNLVQIYLPIVGMIKS
jgi:hypothetical protein